MDGKYQLSGYTSGQQKPLSKSGPDALGRCAVHGKIAWATRKAARRAAKNRHPEGGKSPYPCAHTNGWHYGTAQHSRDIYRGVEDGEEDPRGEMEQDGDEHQQPGKFTGPEEAQGIPDQQVR